MIGLKNNTNEGIQSKPHLAGRVGVKTEYDKDLDSLSS